LGLCNYEKKCSDSLNLFHEPQAGRFWRRVNQDMSSSKIDKWEGTKPTPGITFNRMRMVKTGIEFNP
jgi:hypothetical protein